MAAPVYKTLNQGLLFSYQKAAPKTSLINRTISLPDQETNHGGLDRDNKSSPKHINETKKTDGAQPENHSVVNYSAE
jgi:hypothetical protein